MLDLRRPDAIAGAGDHVVLAADVPEIAVGSLPAEVAGEQELYGIFLCGRCRIAPVFDHGARVRLAHADDATFALGEFLAALIDDTDVEPRRRAAHRSRPDRKQS